MIKKRPAIVSYAILNWIDSRSWWQFWKDWEENGERKVRERTQASGFMWTRILKTVSGSNGDDNNTREKGIDVGIYVALCDFE